MHKPLNRTRAEFLLDLSYFGTLDAMNGYIEPTPGIKGAFRISASGHDALREYNDTHGELLQSATAHVSTLEAENAALKAERDKLRALLVEAKQVIAPLWDESQDNNLLANCKRIFAFYIKL